MKRFRVIHEIAANNGKNYDVETVGSGDTPDEVRYRALDMLQDNYSFLRADGYHVFEISCEDITEEVKAFEDLLGDINIDF